MPSSSRKKEPRLQPAKPAAYSRLSELIAARNLTVGKLNQMLVDMGYAFNNKTLYRLASPEPFSQINASVVGAVCKALDVEIGKVIVWQPPTPKLRRVDLTTQKRLDYLMARSNEGELTEGEQEEMDRLIPEMEKISMENAKILAKHKLLSAKKRERQSPARPRVRQAMKRRKPISA